MDEQASRQFPIREDMPFQRRTWRVERLSWIVLALLILAALTGLFGHGPLGKARAQNGPLSVDFERFQRVTRLTDFTIRIGAGAEPVLKLNRAFQDAYEIASIVPRPERSAAAADGIELTFARPGPGDLVVVLFAHPHRWGPRRVEAQTTGGGPVPLPIFVYP